MTFQGTDWRPGLLYRLQVFKMVEAKRVVTWHFYFTKLMPIGLFMAATLHFGNLVYLYLTVSFIQMLKVRRHSW